MLICTKVWLNVSFRLNFSSMRKWCQMLLKWSNGNSVSFCTLKSTPTICLYIICFYPLHLVLGTIRSRSSETCMKEGWRLLVLIVSKKTTVTTALWWAIVYGYQCFVCEPWGGPWAACVSSIGSSTTVLYVQVACICTSQVSSGWPLTHFGSGFPLCFEELADSLTGFSSYSNRKDCLG